MARFNASNFMQLTNDNLDLDIHSAKFKDIRFSVATTQIVEVDASTEANLPAIADKYLGDQNLWWLLLDYNGLLDPIEDIYPGQRLNIPDRKSVIAFLDATPTTQSPTVVII
jgi:hypothetical protein